MGWLIALGVLALIAILPVGVSAIYDAGGPQVCVIAGFMRISVFPRQKREKKPKETEKKQMSSKPAVKKKTAPKSGGSIFDFLPLVDTVLDFLSAFRRKLRINHLQMKLILAGDDPAALAQNYGRAWAALGNLFPLIENAFVIEKRDMEVECDFLADQTTITARMDLSITIGRISLLLLVNGVPVLRELLKIMKLRKGGAKA